MSTHTKTSISFTPEEVREINESFRKGHSPGKIVKDHLEKKLPRAPELVKIPMFGINAPLTYKKEAIKVLKKIEKDISTKLSELSLPQELITTALRYCYPLNNKTVSQANLETLPQHGVLPHVHFHPMRFIQHKTHLALEYSILAGASLQRVYLQYAHLEHAQFQSTDLTRSNLFKANAQYTNFRAAYLKDSNLKKANCFYANFQNANLTNANLTSANFNNACLDNADLTNVTSNHIKLTNVRINKQALASLEEGNSEKTAIFLTHLLKDNPLHAELLHWKEGKPLPTLSNIADIFTQPLNDITMRETVILISNIAPVNGISPRYSL